jgi:hypothetical protein
MSPTQPGAHRPDRRIALIKPASPAEDKAAHAMHLFESMLWAFTGTMRSNWVLASVDAADVIVVHQVDCDERVPSWQESGKAVVVIVTEQLAEPAEQLVLMYPFRAAQVLELLDRLDVQLATPSSRAASPVERAVENAPMQPAEPWSFVEALRTMRQVQNSDVWLTGRAGQTPILWVKGDGTEYVADPTAVHGIRLGTLRLNELTFQKGSPPPAYLAPRPAVEISWFAGYHASRRLAPWLHPAASYRMTRWPNFGVIRALPSQIRVTAILATTALTVQQITARAQVSLEEAVRTMNALAACELLVAVEPVSPVVAPPTQPPQSVPTPPGGIRTFVRLMRKRLGLSSMS